MLTRMIGALVAMVCIVNTVVAQPPGGPGQGNGFGSAPGVGRPPGPADSMMALLGIPEVRAEIDLKDEQAAKVDPWIRRTRDSLRDVMRGFDFRALFDLSEQERRQKMADLERQRQDVRLNAEEDLKAWLSETQLSRLNQLRLQQLGPLALMRPEVTEKLRLTQEQQDAVQEKIGPGPMPGLPPNPGRPPVALDDVLGILSAQQRRQWEKLLGEPFRLPQGDMRPGGGTGPGGPGGFGGPGGPGGGGGPFGGPNRELLAEFDTDGNGWLNNEERRPAREMLEAEQANGGGRGRFGPRRGRGNAGTPEPGERVAVEDVETYPNASLYEGSVLRTLFLEFENEDWEKELQTFHNTDVEVPVTLIVDGNRYENVGVHFRGASSYGMVSEGFKRSLNLSLDIDDSEQRLDGYKTLNLLNCNADDSFMSSVLYSHVARQYLPAPKANFVRVVINGENWGVYANVQQFNKEFLSENYDTTKGTRWKVPGSPRGRGGMEYNGDNIDDYRGTFEIKSKDKDKAWEKLIHFCKMLNETPIEELPAAIEPLTDIDELLWFLALDVALINNDGYWVRSSDYSIYLDDEDRFHFIPHDMNEAFHGAPMRGGPGRGGPGGRADRGGQIPGGPGAPQGPGGFGPPGGPGGPGGFGPPGGGSVDLDPLVAMDDPTKPLRSRLLAVPAYREQYLDCVKTIARESLDWNNLGPVVRSYRELIEDDLRKDTRKLSTFEAFQKATADAAIDKNSPEITIRSFADRRREFLLNGASAARSPAGR